VDPTTLLDPAQRLVALQDDPVPKTQWGAIAHWSALADSARAAGDPALELEALDHLWRVSPSLEPNVRFAEAAVDRGERLHAASHAIRVAVQRYEGSYSTERETLEEQRQRFAHALVVQGRIDIARGRTDRAGKELSRALVVGGPNAESFLGLGMMESTHDWAAAPLLGSALAALPEGDPRRDAALGALNERLAKGKGWVPDADTYVRASRQSPVGLEPPLDARPFADLPIQIDGEERMLLDTPGPLVVDVWATWCGPCKEALPHVETLARTYEGRVTVIAASVDKDAATPKAYLEARGQPSFVWGWLDPTSVQKLGVGGIPVVFVFDAEHRLVARLPGYSPGSRAIESAVEKVLGE
jgi:thiol-disulfide isomerase/thioredoxin